MALRLVMGVAGSGKTTYAFEEALKTAALDRNKQVFVIVPDQFAQETARILSERNKGGILNIEALSFKRLAFRALEEYRGEVRTILTDEGKVMLLRKIFIENKDKLVFFNKGLDRPGFLDECKSLLSEFLEYDVSDDDMSALMDALGEDGRTAAKLRDLKLIYDALMDRMGESYRMSEELIPMLASMVPKLSFLDGASIFLDDYTGFTPVQYELLRVLLKHCKDMTVTVTTDGDESRTRTGARSDMFAISIHTIDKLTQVAREEGVEIAEPVIVGYGEEKSSYRLKDNPAIRFIADHIFSYDGEKYAPQAGGDTGADADDGSGIPVKIHACRTPAAEAEFVAREIEGLISKGVKPERIAVVTGDPEGYAPHFIRSFSARGIPFFMDIKKSLGANPLTDYLMSFWEMRRGGYTMSGVIRFLRGGLSPLSPRKTDELENYMLASGRRGYKAFSEEWVYDADGSYDDKRLKEINGYRVKFIDSISEAEESLKGGAHTVREFSECLCRLMVKNSLKFRLEKKAEEFAENGDILQAQAYNRLYDAVLSIMEALVELLGEEKVSLDDYIRILRSGISEGVLGFVPYASHQVIVGDVERTRLGETDYLFFPGNVDAVFPKVSQAKGLLTQAEREKIERTGIQLAPGREELYNRELFYMYRLISRPEKMLYMTYSMLNDNGDGLIPSYMIGSIKALFEDGIDVVYDTAFERTSVYGQGHLNIYKDRRKAVLSPEAVKAVYGDELHAYVTRFEKFASCPYAHFLRYGIRVDVRKEYKPNMADSGNVFHNSFEKLLGKMNDDNKTWKTITDADLKKLGSDCFDEEADKYRDRIFNQDKRTEYALGRMKKIYMDSLGYLKAHMDAGKFEQAAAEISFPDQLPSSELTRTLSSGALMKLSGKIDRLDIYKEDDKQYIKIVDYKSSARGLSLSKVYYGLELQLLTYLKIAKSYASANADNIPAGAFFQGIEEKAGKWDAKLDTAGEYEKREKDSFKPDGYVNSDYYKLIDTTINENNRKSYAMPVTLTQGGVPHGSWSKTLETKQFEDLMSFTMDKIDEIGERIYSGDISVKPCEIGGGAVPEVDACRYCNYAAICGIESRSKKEVRVRYKTLRDDEVLTKVAAKTQSNTGAGADTGADDASEGKEAKE